MPAYVASELLVREDSPGFVRVWHLRVRAAGLGRGQNFMIEVVVQLGTTERAVESATKNDQAIGEVCGGWCGLLFPLVWLE